MEQRLELLLESDQSLKTTLTALRRSRSVSERLKRAGKTTLPLWVVAIVGIFVPILHFVIVPAALIAILVLGGREMILTESFVVEGLKCPHCQTLYGETEVAGLPKRLTCLSCRITSTLDRK